jgi:hypothetical protein
MAPAHAVQLSRVSTTLEFKHLLGDALDTVRHYDPAVKDALLTGRFRAELSLR